MAKLQIIVGSTRPGRAALPIATWVAEQAREHGGLDVDLVDVAEFDLPVLDEPLMPRLEKYEHDHTRRWSAKIDEADAFVFVTPEYNYGPSVALLNAVDYLHREWGYKPVAFVSYGGVAAGLRSVQAMKQVVTTLRMMPIPEGVSVPFVMQHLSPDGFAPPPGAAAAAGPMFDELVRWTEALHDLRHGPPPPPPPPPPGAPVPPGPPSAHRAGPSDQESR